jgi:hypothetical protein
VVRVRVADDEFQRLDLRVRWQVTHTARENAHPASARPKR